VTACAIEAAATSSETSPGSSRTTNDVLHAGLLERLDLGKDRSWCPSSRREIPGAGCGRSPATASPDWQGRTSCRFFFAFGGNPQLRGDFRHDRTAISDGETARSQAVGAWMRAMSESSPLSPQAFAALAVGLSRAERADYRSIALEAVQQRGSSISESCVSARSGC